MSRKHGAVALFYHAEQRQTLPVLGYVVPQNSYRPKKFCDDTLPSPSRRSKRWKITARLNWTLLVLLMLTMAGVKAWLG